MRFSIRQLLLTTVLLATAIAIGIPAGKFLVYDKVNFDYDHQQATYYIRDLTGVRGKMLNDAFDQMTVWNRNDLFIARATESPTKFTLEWITANTRKPDRVIATLDTGDEILFTVTDVNSTSAVSYFTDIPTENKIPIESTVESVRICIGRIESDECIVQPLMPTGGG